MVVQVLFKILLMPLFKKAELLNLPVMMLLTLWGLLLCVFKGSIHVLLYFIAFYGLLLLIVDTLRVSALKGGI